MRPGDARSGGRGRRRRPPRRGPQPRRGLRPRWPGLAPPWPPAGGEWAQVDLLQCPVRELTADPACPRAARRTQGSSPQVPAEDLAQRAEAPSRDSDWKAALRSLAARSPAWPTSTSTHTACSSVAAFSPSRRCARSMPAWRHWSGRASIARQQRRCTGHCSHSPSAMGCWSCRPLRCLVPPSWSGW